MLDELGTNEDHDTRDASELTTQNLANHEVIIFLNTTRKQLRMLGSIK